MRFSLGFELGVGPLRPSNCTTVGRLSTVPMHDTEYLACIFVYEICYDMYLDKDYPPNDSVLSV